MFELSSIQPMIASTLIRSSLKDYQKIVFNAAARAVLDGVSIDGKLIGTPAVAVDTLNNEPALILVFSFYKGADEFNYTFQFEVWPTGELMRINPPAWLPNKVTTIPKPKMKLSFLAERNSVVYFERAYEGTFEETVKEIGIALGK